MAWVKVDDSFYDSEKWAEAPADSIGLWLAAMAWCNRNNSVRGFIPELKTQGLVHVRNHKATVVDLCRRGAFHKVDGGYLIHDYEEYQQNDKVKRIAEERSKAGKKGARARWANKTANAEANAIANVNDSECPVPESLLLVTSENISTSLPTVEGGGDNSRRERIARLYGQHAAIIANAKTQNYWRTCADRVVDSAEMARLLAEYPTAPDSVLAAALHGERHSLGMYQKQTPGLHLVEPLEQAQ